MNFAIIGTGYAAQFYADTWRSHAGVRVIGAADLDRDRCRRFAKQVGIKDYESPDELLKDPNVEAVVNLTNLASHFEVSMAAIQAGKHVYCEKPLASTLAQANKLVAAAQSVGVEICSAPCSVLGPAAHAVDQLIRGGAIGRPLIAHAQMHDGAVHLMRHELWRRDYNVPWPANNEFSAGCVLEHAGYVISWLNRFFGPVRSLTAHVRTIVPQKIQGKLHHGPDYAISVMEFAHGIQASVSCNTIAPRDRSLLVVGEEGVVWVDDVWDYNSPVRLQTVQTPSSDSPHIYLSERQTVANSNRQRSGHTSSDPSHQMDFSLGLAELSTAVRRQRVCRLGGDFALHTLEVLLAIHKARCLMGASGSLNISSSFDADMYWGREYEGDLYSVHDGETRGPG